MPRLTRRPRGAGDEPACGGGAFRSRLRRRSTTPVPGRRSPGGPAGSHEISISMPFTRPVNPSMSAGAGDSDMPVRPEQRAGGSLPEFRGSPRPRRTGGCSPTGARASRPARQSYVVGMPQYRDVPRQTFTPSRLQCSRTMSPCSVSPDEQPRNRRLVESSLSSNVGQCSRSRRMWSFASRGVAARVTAVPHRSGWRTSPAGLRASRSRRCPSPMGGGRPLQLQQVAQPGSSTLARMAMFGDPSRRTMLPCPEPAREREARPTAPAGRLKTRGVPGAQAGATKQRGSVRYIVLGRHIDSTRASNQQEAALLSRLRCNAPATAARSPTAHAE